MATSGYVSAMVMWGKRSAANVAALEKYSCDIWNRIQVHGGSQLVSFAAPGQHIGYSRGITLQEEFSSVNEALEIIRGKPAIVQTAYPVFW